MNIRKGVKKIVALGAGVTMLGATFLSAGAADLADYPEPFVQEGVANAVIVVGEKAATADVVGAIDIASSLQAMAVTTTKVSVDGAGVSVSGGKTEEVDLNTGLNTDFGTLDDDDLPALMDTELNIDIGNVDNDYDVSDSIVLSSGISVETGITTTSPDEDFKDRVFLEVAKNSIRYVYNFDETLDPGNFLNDSDSDDEIVLTFLGKDLEITGASANSITVEVGTEYFLNAGDVANVEGVSVTLVKTSDGAAVVDVDGTRYTIDNDESKNVGNGLKVEVSDIFNDDGTEFDSATLKIGDDVSKTYTDGDEFIGEDEDDPNWVWDIENANTNAPTLAIQYDQVLDEDDEVIYVGEEIELPWGFASITIDSLNQDSYQEYTVEAVTEDLSESTGTNVTVTSARVLHIEAAGGNDNGFEVNTGGTLEETDDIYFYLNTTADPDQVQVFWKDDDDNDIKDAMVSATNTSTATNVSIDFKDTNLAITAAVSDNGGQFNVTIDDITFFVEGATNQITYLGDSDGDTTTANDVRVAGNDISGWEEDTMNSKGIKIMSYEDSDSADELTISVPKETGDFKANVVVKTEGSVVSSGATGSVMTDSVNAIAVGLGVLDKDVTVGSQNMIVVGGPCVNTAAAELMGNPANCAEGFDAGKAMIKLFENNGKTSMLVAGYGAQDTQGATRVVANYADHDLSGSEASVTVTSLNNVMVDSMSEN